RRLMWPAIVTLARPIVARVAVLAARVLQHLAGLGEQRGRPLGAPPAPRERVRAAQPGGGLRVGRARAVAPAQRGGGQRGDQEDGLWRACPPDRAVARPGE